MFRRLPGHRLLALVLLLDLTILASWVLARTLARGLLRYWGRASLLLVVAWALGSAWAVLRHGSQRPWVWVGLAVLIGGALGVAVPSAGLVGLLLAGFSVQFLAPAIFGLGMREWFRARKGRTANVHAALHGRTLRPLVGLYGAALAGAAMLTMANVAHSEPAIAPSASTAPDAAAAELRRMVAAADEDFRLGRFVVDAARDSLRVARTEALLAAGAVRAADAWYHAAVLLQRGPCASHQRRANAAAREAAAAGVRPAERLALETYDRWLLATGRPQRHGTQLGLVQRLGCPGDAR